MYVYIYICMYIYTYMYNVCVSSYRPTSTVASALGSFTRFVVKSWKDTEPSIDIIAKSDSQKALKTTCGSPTCPQARWMLSGKSIYKLL